MSSVRNELALANAQELINVRGIPSPCIMPSQLIAYCGARSTSPPTLFLTQKTNDKCYAKCITKPSTSLSSSEEVRIHFWHEISFRLISLSSLFLKFFGFRFISSRLWLWLVLSTL